MMMATVLAAAIVFLVLNLAAGLVRVARGPSASDRMLAALLFGSTTVAVLLLLAEWTGQPAAAPRSTPRITCRCCAGSGSHRHRRSGRRRRR